MVETLLFEVGVMFAALATVSFVADRVDVSPIPLYILVGIILNPFVLGRVAAFSVSENDFIAISAEIGIVLLLFFLGLEFHFDRLIADKDRIGKSGVLDFVVNFGVGFVLGYVLFQAVVPAVFIAGVVYISSSAVISKTLIDLGWIANPESSPLLGTLVFEDIVIAGYLAILSAFVLRRGDFGTAIQSIVIAGVFLGALALIAYAGTSVFNRMLATNSSEYVLLRTLGITLLIAGIALGVG